MKKVNQVKDENAALNCKHFYMSTIKKSTSVTDCVQGHFTRSPISQQELLNQKIPSNMYKLDNNLIIARTNSFQVLRILQDDLEEMFEIPVYEQIVNILRVSTAPFVQKDNITPGKSSQQKAGRLKKTSMLGESAAADHEIQPDQPADMIFVLTSNFNTYLYRYTTDNGFVVQSKGNIADLSGTKKDAPYSCFVGANGKNIVMMLYDNTIKVIPLTGKDQESVHLLNSFNLKIKHPETHQCFPIHFESHLNEGGALGVFYQQQNHVSQALQLRMKRYYLQVQSKDLTSADENHPNQDIVELSQNVYHIQPLCFGGFLAIEGDQIHCYRRNIQEKLLSLTLRKSLRINAFAQLDEFDPSTNKTKDGTYLLRYIFGTECGELYIILFDLKRLNLLTSVVKPTNVFECNKFMNIEYLGANLSSCQSLSYLNNSYIYYGSIHGDSYIIQLNQEKVADHGYYSIVKTFPSLGQIKHLQMRQGDSNSQQSELIVAGGKGKNSHISILKKGISLKNVQSIADLPQIADNGIFTLGDKLFLKFYGFNYLVPLQTTIGNDKTILFQDVALNENLRVDDEEVILISKCSQNSIALITSKRVRLLSDDLLSKISENLVSSISLASVEQEIILICVDGRTLMLFDASNISKPSAQMTFSTQFSAIAISEKEKIAYVAHWDAPDYSISVIDLQTLSTLVKYSSSLQSERISSKRFSLNHQLSQSLELEFNTGYPMTAIKSIQTVGLDNNQDQVLCALADGRVLQFNCDLEIISRIRDNPKIYHPQINSTMDDNKISSPQAIWNIAINSFGMQEIVLKKIHSSQGNPLILAQCDRPAVFYMNRDGLQLQYLNVRPGSLGQLDSLSLHGDVQVFISNDIDRFVQFGSVDDFEQIQIERFPQDMEINFLATFGPQTQNPALQKLMIGLMETPELEFANTEKPQAVNQVGLFDKDQVQLLSSFKLQKLECLNSAVCFEKRIIGDSRLSNLVAGDQALKQGFVIVGTSFVDNEPFPTKGRIIILKINSRSRRLKVRHIENVNGSVNALEMMGAESKYLVAGIHNELHFFTLTAATAKTFKLTLNSKSFKNTCIQDIKVVNNTIFVGDLMKSVTVFDIKEQTRLGVMNVTPKLQVMSQNFQQIWVSSLLPLNVCQSLVFDRERNLYLFERNFLPTSEIEKLKLDIVACTRSNEVITHAIEGDLNIQTRSLTTDDDSESTMTSKSYLNRSSMIQTEEIKQSDVEMIDTSSNQQPEAIVVAEPNKNEKESLRQLLNEAIDEFRTSSQRQFLYGTLRGSIGTLIELPDKAYQVLGLLQNALDKLFNGEEVMSRETSRKVVAGKMEMSSTNIIDGESLQKFGELDLKRQTHVVSQIFTKDYVLAHPTVVKEVKQILALIKDKC